MLHRHKVQDWEGVHQESIHNLEMYYLRFCILH